MQALQTWCAQGSRKGVRSRSGCVAGSYFEGRLKSLQQTGQFRLSGSSVSGSISGIDLMKMAKSDSKHFRSTSQIPTSMGREKLSRIFKRSKYNISPALATWVPASVWATADMLETAFSENGGKLVGGEEECRKGRGVEDLWRV